MRITGIHLRNFKRFTDLTITGIPTTARLVLVVGPNGCGKSSLFDALHQWYRDKTGFGIHTDDHYYRKAATEPFHWADVVAVTLDGNAQPRKGCFYLRTAYRHDPDFSVANIARPSAPSETIRFNRVIEADSTVSENYQRLVYETMSSVYNVANDDKTVRALREELVGDIRRSMQAVFGDLLLNNISDPLGAGAFFFEKGASKNYHYKNLSGGEKAAFGLLLDVHAKKAAYTNAIYCIDEIETHLHTRVQGAMLRELTAILPPDSQMWITTHSLGVIRAAQSIAHSTPGSVAVIDFDGVDPDIPRQLMPSDLDRVTWDKMLSIALDDLSPRIAPKVVIVCEGSTVGNRRKDFDAEIYNRVLGTHNPEIVFVSGGSSNQVQQSGISIREVLQKITPTSKVLALRDRDDLSPTEVAQHVARGDLVLPERHLETFLFSDEVIEALVIREQKQHLLPDALKIKADSLSKSVARGNAPDDVKSAAGDIYTGLKRLLELTKCGNNADAFMRDTLAPLITPTMMAYATLRHSIVDVVM